MQIKVDKTGTDPTMATITTRSHEGGEELVDKVSGEENAIAMTDILENHPDGSKLGVWRGEGC